MINVNDNMINVNDRMTNMININGNVSDSVIKAKTV